MKGFQIQQKGERRISAALRIMLVIFLLAVQIALVVAISYFMQEYLALAYAVVQVADGSVLRDAAQVASGDALRVRLTHGEVAATVD